MEPIAWELSDVKVEESSFIKAVEGRQIVKFMSATHDKANNTYNVNVWSSENGAKFDLVYRLKKVSPIDGKLIDNQASFRSLLSLSKAIYGPDGAVKCPIPNPAQVVGCVAIAEVKLNPYEYTKPVLDENGEQVLDENGNPKVEKKSRTYTNVYEYFPVPASKVEELSDNLDQYSVADAE